MMNKLIVGILSLVAATAQAQNTSNNPVLALNQQQNDSILENKTDSVSPQEAATLFSEKKAVIVDVREDDEWNQQHIPGAIHIPLGQLLGRLTELEQYKNTPIITQCQKGGRSQQALTVLKSLKFSKVYNLEGGIDAWNKAGLKTSQ
ncbi:Rhodanese-like protein (modular protein) [Crenothrix polyspora]|uniref:Rhodanese-like protein (Modular protein) n=1 Tax=Crenothrix polyspora TaxID=360316 RepID=A0A1R4H3X6_9GAMM|nr:rhodanese-like domain-containing protein [Crenothrix polyspora]SJM90963.1 Rhodanese-like protein (modular protein) [Crenothrix polyspora]